ncbi:MAG: vancomycin high temperature exclusion protein [Sphingobacteriales bacterium]|nr:MAG: vancomycin high temperature exclusion protein [Sphingobacteriales bacterium]
MKAVKYLIIFAIIAIAATFAVDKWVKNSVQDKLYSNTALIPHNKVGLLLGTSKTLSNGNLNYYYQYRIEATVQLYKAGKIDYVLISGDNSTSDYNEPEEMRNDLMAAGIPIEKIFLDYAGFRTLDSIVRCAEVFGEHNITVISQQFHNERAVFIADRKEVHAIAFNAQDVNKYAGAKVLLREKFARVKMVLDLIFSKQPHFLGQKINIK